MEGGAPLRPCECGDRRDRSGPFDCLSHHLCPPRADEENESSSSEDEEEDRRRLSDELLGKVCSIEAEEDPTCWYLALVGPPGFSSLELTFSQREGPSPRVPLRGREERRPASAGCLCGRGRGFMCVALSVVNSRRGCCLEVT